MRLRRSALASERKISDGKMLRPQDAHVLPGICNTRKRNHSLGRAAIEARFVLRYEARRLRQFRRNGMQAGVRFLRKRGQSGV